MFNNEGNIAFLFNCSKPLAVIVMQSGKTIGSTSVIEGGMRNKEKAIKSKIPDEILTAFANHQYIPLEKIGEGGFCIVFKARNRKTDQLVAIKVLKRQFEAKEEDYRKNLIRFNNETKLCAKLNHPNIVTLLDKGQLKSMHFSVFEFINGHSLKEELFNVGALTPRVAADIMTQVLHALSHAHQQGIVHRDVKPANIMLNKQGQKTYVKLLDFGISASALEPPIGADADPPIEETTGTLSYVAPEQLQGCPPTPKSDIYAWGLVFIECLTGRRVMSGTCLASIIQQQLCLEDIALSEEIEKHPISQVLKLAIKKEADSRINDANDLYEKLSYIDLSTLSPQRNVSILINTNSKYSEPKGALQTLACKNYQAIIDNEQQATTALCVTIKLHSDSNTHKVISEQIEETLLQTLYEDKKNQCISVAQRYGATLTGRLVDTLLFFFGYPKTLSTDSLLCAKAAMEITHTVNQPIFINNNSVKVFCTVHIGIHSGSFWRNSHVFPEGEIPRTAMALARVAGANQILCSHPTHDLLSSGAYFETSHIEKHYKYNATPRSYAIIREREETTVDSLRFKTNLLPLIGHENELSQLEKLVASSSTSQKNKSCCAHIHGEGGIGKSRIIAELCLQKNTLDIWSMQCLPHKKNSKLSIILNLIKRMYGLHLGSEEKVVLKIQNLLEKHPNLDTLKSTAILCSWLNLTAHEECATSSTAVKSTQNELFKILICLLCKNNSEQTGKHAIFILDDMHWLDAASLQFISALISSDTFKKSGHTLVTSSRQSLPSILYGKIDTVIKINRLDHKNATALIAASLSKQQVSKELTDLIVQRTDGIPLFIIEFVRMLKENDWAQRLNGKISLVEPNNIPLIPYTLRDLLEKRLDNLTCDMRVVQLASVIGQEFDYEVLKYSVGPNILELNTTLDELLKQDLIRVQRRGHKKNFMFKHKLLRDAAYNSMPYLLKLEAQELICYSRQQHAQKSDIDTHSNVLARKTHGNFTQ